MVEPPPVTAPAVGEPALQDSALPRQRSLARAARHAILRRLAPALRHDMVVHLQSLGMMAEALSARLDRGAVAPEDVQLSLSKLNRLARQAVHAAVTVSTWMEPAEDNTVPLREGVQECVGLLASSLNFRGYALRSEVGEADIEVTRGALRFLLAAAILALTDGVEGPGDVTVRAEASSSHAVVEVSYVEQPERTVFALQEQAPEPLSWPEIQALAAEEQVEVRRNDHSIILRLPRALVTSPLKMAPV